MLYAPAHDHVLCSLEVLRLARGKTDASAPWTAPGAVAGNDKSCPVSESDTAPVSQGPFSTDLVEESASVLHPGELKQSAQTC